MATYLDRTQRCMDKGNTRTVVDWTITARGIENKVGLATILCDGLANVEEQESAVMK